MSIGSLFSDPVDTGLTYHGVPLYETTNVASYTDQQGNVTPEYFRNLVTIRTNEDNSTDKTTTVRHSASAIGIGLWAQAKEEGYGTVYRDHAAACEAADRMIEVWKNQIADQNRQIEMAFEELGPDSRLVWDPEVSRGESDHLHVDDFRATQPSSLGATSEVQINSPDEDLAEEEKTIRYIQQNVVIWHAIRSESDETALSGAVALTSQVLKVQSYQMFGIITASVVTPESEIPETVRERVPKTEPWGTQRHEGGGSSIPGYADDRW